MKPYPLTDKDSIDLLMMGSVKAGFPSPAEEVRPSGVISRKLP